MPGKRRTIAGRSAMITGAASGIGRALPRRLSPAGSPVAIADLAKAWLKENADSLSGPVQVTGYTDSIGTDQVVDQCAP